MNASPMLAVQYDLIRVIGGHLHLRPLLAGVLQRMLYHTGFPAGIVLEAREAQGLELYLVMGSRTLAQREDQQVLADVDWAGGAVTLLQGPEGFGPAAELLRDFGTALRLPIRDFGAIVLLGLEELLLSWFAHWHIVLGLLLLGIVLFAPKGVAALFGRSRD